MAKKIEIDYETLYDYYITQDMTITKIAIEFNCNEKTIHKRLVDYGIKVGKRGPRIPKKLNYGSWNIISLKPLSTRDMHTKLLCRCKCGYESYVETRALVKGLSKQCLECAGKSFIDMKNKRVGNLLVLERVDSKNSSAMWKCECDCGNTSYVSGGDLRFKTKSCRECSNKSAYRGYEEISSSYITNIKKGAIIRFLDYNVTEEYLWDLFINQNKKCALSGVDISFSRQFSEDCKGQSASLDRIDSSIGYIEGNVQWVHKRINKLKNNFSENDLINMCISIIKHKKIDVDSHKNAKGELI